MVNHDTIMCFLRELKYSCKDMENIFTKGSCFRLCVILKTIFSEAEFLYSEADGHWVTLIEDRLYDINGEVCREWAESMGYERSPEYEASAYIPTYEGVSVYYNKYVESF